MNDEPSPLKIKFIAIPMPTYPIVIAKDLLELYQEMTQKPMVTEQEREEIKKCQFVRMECTSHGHNKFYEVRLVASVVNGQTQYTVSGAWGKISATPEVQVKYAGTNYSLAAATFGRVKAEKNKKEYVIKTELSGDRAAKRLGLGHMIAEEATKNTKPTEAPRKSRFGKIDI